ncbi:MAG: hypothetical protein ACREBC_32885, partial [Pyrinomonadaceae bacterium]
VEFDGISETSADKHLSLVKGMIDSGFLTYTLISQDAGWYHIGEPGGGSYRPYNFVFETFIPMLKKAGVLEEEVRTLLLDNPRRALTLGTKKL